MHLLRTTEYHDCYLDSAWSAKGRPHLVRLARLKASFPREKSSFQGVSCHALANFEAPYDWRRRRKKADGPCRGEHLRINRMLIGAAYASAGVCLSIGSLWASALRHGVLRKHLCSGNVRTSHLGAE
jgi:hypothetical protein